MIIYKITNKINGMQYIGQTIHSLNYRWSQHCSKKSLCHKLSYSIQKYGKENFEIKVITRCNTIEEMNYREEYYIKLFNTLSPNGYNLLPGGNNKKHNEETKQKMRKPRSKQGKLNISNAHKGKIMPEETKLKISLALKGRIFSKELREKLSISAKARIYPKKDLTK